MSSTYELVRDRAAWFDFSAEGRFFVGGEHAVEAVNAIIAADLESTPDLKVLNTLLLDEDAVVLAIVWVLKGEDGVWILCDEDRRAVVADSLAAAAAGREVAIEDRTDATLCLAVIGPAAQEIAMAAAGDDVIGIPYLGFEPNAEIDALVCRIGYTGEFEYRFIAARERAPEITERLLAAGAELGLEAGDPAALSLLMLEMRSLSQREHLPPGTGAIQAGLHWMVNFRKPAFPGREALHAQKSHPGRKAMMVTLDTTEPPAGDVPVRLEDREVGHCVCLAFSPTLEKTIGLGYVDQEFAWVGVVFDVAGLDARAVSSPLFITKTVLNSR